MQHSKITVSICNNTSLLVRRPVFHISLRSLVLQRFITFLLFFFCGAAGQITLGRLIVEVSEITHARTHARTQSRYKVSERVISSMQKWLPTEHTTITKGKHSCLQWACFVILVHSVLHPCLFLCPDCPAFCLFLQHNQNIHAPSGRFSLLYLYFFILIVLALPFVLYCTTHTTQTSMHRRDSNPQPQQAIGRRPSPQTARLLGSAGFDPAIPATKRPQSCPILTRHCHENQHFFSCFYTVQSQKDYVNDIRSRKSLNLLPF
jgi:hypothetical protein